MGVNWSYMITTDKKQKLEVESLLLANAELKGGIISLPIYKHLKTQLLSMKSKINNGKIYDHIKACVISL